jgi:hypothetical protein
MDLTDLTADLPACFQATLWHYIDQGYDPSDLASTMELWCWEELDE